MCLWVYNMFWDSAPIVVLLLAFLATGVTIFAWKVYKIRRSGRVLVNWKIATESRYQYGHDA